MRPAHPNATRLILVGLLAGPFGCATVRTDDAPRAEDAVAVRSVPPALRWSELGARPGIGGESLEEMVARAREDLPRTAATVPAADPRREREALRFYLEGRTARQDGRADEALRLLERARELDPDRAAILRELGRAQQLAGRSDAAVATFARLLEIEPFEPNAVYALMLEAGRRDDQVETMRLGLGMRAAGRRFGQDPAAPLVADELLRRALLASGHERAALEIGRLLLEATAAYGEATNLGSQLSVVLRSRADIALACADSALRLDLPQDALDLLEAAEGAATVDPSALLERRLVALRRLAREDEAQALFVAHVARAPEGVGGAACATARWLASAGDAAALRTRLLSAAQAAPESDGLVRVVAAISTRAEAERLLSTRLARGAGVATLPLLGDLLALVGKDDPDTAIREAAGLAAREPYLVGQIATMLQRTVTPGCAFPREPVAESLRIRLLMRLDEPGAAWRETEAARRRWADDESLLRLAIDLGGVLDEAPLLDAALAAIPATSEPATRIVAIGAKIAAGRFEEAAADAVEIRTRTPAPEPIERAWSLTLQARALSEIAETAPVGPARNDLFRQVSALASQALEQDPHQHQAWLLLVAVHGPKGPLAEPARMRAVVRAVPDDPTGRGLLSQLRAAEFAGQGQHAAAIAVAARQVLDDPDDEASLGILAGSLAETGRADAARDAILSRVRSAPGDLVALGQVVRLALRTDAAESTLPELDALRAAGVPAEAIDRQREILLGTLGRIEEGTALAEARMARRPPGSRRLLQEAGIALRAGDATKARDRLEAMLEPSLAATRRHLLTALGLCGQLPADDSRANELRVALLETSAARFESVPLSAYNAGLVAAAQLGLADDPRYARLVQAALACGAPVGPSLREFAPWREIVRNVSTPSPRAAARLLVALHALPEPLDDDALKVLSSMTIVGAFTLDDGESTIATALARLESRGLLQGLPGIGAVADADEALVAVAQAASTFGFDDMSDRLLARALATTIDDAMARNNLGYARIVRGRGDAETVALVESAAAARPDDASVRDTLAWLRYLQGRNDEALEILRGIVSKLGDEASGELLDHLGDAAWRAGDAATAADAWRRAVVRWHAEAAERPADMMGDFLLFVWGLRVVDPQVIYDRDFTEPIRRAEAKLAALDEGVPPAVAPTFSERTAAE